MTLMRIKRLLQLMMNCLVNNDMMMKHKHVLLLGPGVYQHLEVLDAYLEMFVCSGACAWILARASFRSKQLSRACQAELL